MNGKLLAIRTDWSKVDAHVIRPEEYEELPEWTDDMFEAADVRIGGQLVHPAESGTKVSTTVHFGIA
ncbi:MAG: hypothetical protein H7829_04015 [Magnetococcus sp. THC-1_WYH]